MATLTNSTAFTIAAASTETADTTVEVVSVAAAGEGRGRLIHPTLGTFDYPYMPREWTNLDQDAVIAPVWQHQRTLGGGTATLWPGNIKDVVCTEKWEADDLSMPMSMLRMLVAIWQNPPDPDTDYVQWWPSYTTTLGFDVAVVGLSVGGSPGTALTDLTFQGWCDQGVTITYRLRGYAV